MCQKNMALFRAVFIVMATVSLNVVAQDYGNYLGKGGMSAYDIKRNVYEYHYDKGFTGEDAMGWDPNLQYAWSRLGAAKTCNVSYPSEKIIEQLIAKYGENTLTHEMVGINFHAAQSKANPSFCTLTRIDEIKDLLPAFEAGNFPKKF